MKNLLFLTILSTFLSLSLTKAQPVVDANINNEKVYWFYIKPALVINDDLKKEVLSIQKFFGKIHSGPFDQFIRDSKNELASNKVAIGPFVNEGSAKKAGEYYSLLSKKNFDAKKLKEINDDGMTYYYYLSEPIFDPEKQKIRFERMPAAVASGPGNEFVDILLDALNHKLLANGPFVDYLSAEKSKFICRKHVGKDAPEIQIISNSDLSLVKMAKIWKSVNIYILKDITQNKPEKVSYVFEIEFPPLYFDQNTLQACVFTLEYSDSTKRTVYTVSFQGEGFKDNNEIVYFEAGGTYRQRILVPYMANKKPQTVIVSSVLFGDNQILKCENIYLKLENN